MLSRHASDGAVRYLEDHTPWKQNRRLFQRAVSGRAERARIGK